MSGTIVAVAATILMCMHGVADVNDKCPDGSDLAKLEISILTGSLSDLPECQGFSEAWRNQKKCINKFDSVIEIRRDQTILFQLKPDGSSTHASDFSPDDGARALMQAFNELMKQSLTDQPVLFNELPSDRRI